MYKNPKELSLDIEAYFKNIFNFNNRPIATIFDSDSLMAGSFYCCMNTMIRIFNLSDDILKKYKYIDGVILSKIENAESIFLEFKELINEHLNIN